MKHIIHHMEPLTDDDALRAPLPRRLGHRDPYLEPISLRGIWWGIFFGALCWAVIFLLIVIVEKLS